MKAGRVTILKKTLLASAPYAFLLAVISVFVFSNPIYDRSVTSLLKVDSGRADLSENPDGITQIQGEWNFWWKNFVSDPDAVPADGVCVLPGTWKNAGIKDAFGWASFGLAVTGLEPGKTYAFRIGQTLSACRILVDGETVRSIGTPGTSLSQEVPSWNSVLARFKPRSDGSVYIIVQISNHYDKFGGSNASLYIGEASLMAKMEDRQNLTEGLVFAVLWIMGLFFLALFLFRHREVPFLWFAGICALVGFRTLCYDGFSLLSLFPSMSWLFFLKVGYLTFPLILIVFIGFLRSIFPSIVEIGYFIAVFVIFMSYALIICLAPVFITAILLFPFQLVGLAVALYGIVVIILACVRRLESARWLLSGFTFAVISFTYDTLVSMWLISGFSLGYLGMILCLFTLALMVIERYSSSFRKARSMSEQLKIINSSLRRFVPSEFLSFLRRDSIAEVELGDNVEVDMAILSADIRSFSAIAEKMKMDDVFAYLNEYLQLVGPIVRANGGFIAKYEGDGFFALFPNGAEPALRCAVQIQSAILSRNRRLSGKNPIAVGIGIDAGKITLGTVGDVSRMDGAVISHCVSCAGKLEEATKLYQARILINGAVFSGLSDPQAYFLRPVDRIDVAGQASFLFEVYNNDEETTRELKRRTQGDLEHAVFAYFAGQFTEAKTHLSRVLSEFPDDPVAQHYARRLSL